MKLLHRYQLKVCERERFGYLEKYYIITTLLGIEISRKEVMGNEQEK